MRKLSAFVIFIVFSTPSKLLETLLCNTSIQWQCVRSGECIQKIQFCDGVIDCNDTTDESEITCKDIKCPGFAFRCSYGACVGGDAKCNGVKDCSDGSDEIGCLNMDLIKIPTLDNKACS